MNKYLTILMSVLIYHGCEGRIECKNGEVLVRKEWRSMSGESKQDYLTALYQLKQDGAYEDMAKAHAEQDFYIHGNPIFLPWNRYFLVFLEQQLQRKSGKAITQPYWDWDRDAAAPEQSEIWTAFGSSKGQPEGAPNEYCVTDGIFGNQTFAYPEPRCLLRMGMFEVFKQTPMALMDADKLGQVVTSSSNYDAFCKNILGQPLSNLHFNIGGHMFSPYSPIDPVFYLHHAKLDKLWWQWQQQKPEFATEYNGSQRLYPARPRKGEMKPATVDDVLYPFVEWKVGDTFDTKSLCYTYPSPSVKQASSRNRKKVVVSSKAREIRRE